MSAHLRCKPPAANAARPLRVALFGTGQVASALVAALQRQAAAPPLRLAQVANTRVTLASEAWDWRGALAALASAGRAPSTDRDPHPRLLADVDVVVDATASDGLAEAHAGWLAQGIAVVTANKRGLGESQERASRILAECAHTAYGDSATVGAGLGAIRRLRALHARGERVESIAGVLSGSLAWLFEKHDGRAPFSAIVREASALGLTEPDPREDVSGADVVRKLRILARAAGWAAADKQVVVDPRLRCGSGPDAWGALEALDDGMAALLDGRPQAAAKLAVVARGESGALRVGLEWLAPEDPLAQRVGCDNVIEIRSTRYRERPLILRGPGAGPALTAEALLDDLVDLARAPAARPQPRHGNLPLAL